LIKHDIVDNDRLAIAQCACARGHVGKPNVLEEIQELALKAPLRLDFEVTGLPIHELNVAELGLTDL